MTRVFVADDHAVVRLGLRHVLTELGGFEVVGEAANGRQVLNAPDLGECDVLVLDLSLPVVSGTEVLRRVRERHPDVAVIVHSMHPESQFRHRAIQAGAIAYISKDAPPSALVAAINEAAVHPHRVQGGDAAPEDPGDAPPHSKLSRREHQVFMLLVAGRQVAEIAAELDIHSCTVSNHLAKIRTKLGVKTVADMIRYAYASGLAESA